MLCFATANVGVPTDEPSLAVTKVRKPPSFPKSEVLSPLARSKEGAKRSKTDPNQTLLPTLEMCQEAIQAVGNHLPRVGKTEITDQAVLNMLKNVFPDKRIHRVMACRGTEEATPDPAKAEMHPAPNIDPFESHLHEPPACSEKPGSEEGLSPSNVIPVPVTKPPNMEPVENVPKMHAKSMPSSYPEARAEEGSNTPYSAASRSVCKG
ncbi:unnamed protein product [Cladocopium goreaui]|uniref:Uncharacterized protein n=1 Tax=Cladocopium goreaui TaxID=2562237 RepID=A0A9P1M2L2_9DINO|nr:unnamed protein product [Cladocopium goreaui]